MHEIHWNLFEISRGVINHALNNDKRLIFIEGDLFVAPYILNITTSVVEYSNLKVPMKRKFLLPNIRELLKL